MKKGSSGIEPMTSRASSSGLSYSFAVLDGLGFCELQQHNRCDFNGDLVIPINTFSQQYCE
jgi:hypothetical protein